VTEVEAMRLFLHERARFALEEPRLAKATLTVVHARCSPHNPRCAPRDVAWCEPSTKRVYILARALRLPRLNVVALLRHELGHLVCPSCSEVEADAIASLVGGQRIRYDHRDLQTVARRGRSRRPAHLHQ
jgi:hypothetical protein